MAESVQRYYKEGLASSTLRSHQAALKRFHSFCVSYNINSPFQVSENILCSYAAYLADQKLSPQTIKVYLATVRRMQISLGHPAPRDQNSLPILKRVQAGIRRLHTTHGSPAKTRLPITATVLRQIKWVLENSATTEKVAFWAITCTAFFRFFRLGKLLPSSSTSFQPARDLAWGDVAIDNRCAPNMIKVHLKSSKCDQFGTGADVILGRTGA